ncbi:MAG: hypothetical protein WDN28_09250 [Chthoniobacter sp.]
MKTIHRLLLAACGLFLLPPGSRAASALPPIPQPATSFGAAITDGWIYTYGGNTGKAHEFNKECVKGRFLSAGGAGGNRVGETVGRASAAEFFAGELRRKNHPPRRHVGAQRKGREERSALDG